jgi:hypothetical protein
MFIINYKNVHLNQGSQAGALKYDKSVTSDNACPTSVISEESCKEEMVY